MADALHFAMGKYQAVLPGDLRYARNHMWARQVGPGGEWGGKRPPPGKAEGGEKKAPATSEGCWRFGFTSYAIRLMQDVYFLDWSIDAGNPVMLFQEIGHIETSKAESDLFSPLAGTLTTFNQALLNDPSAINVNGYEEGWLFEITSADPSPLMDVEAYLQFLHDNWEKTQRLIKGKINED